MSKYEDKTKNKVKMLKSIDILKNFILGCEFETREAQIKFLDDLQEEVEKKTEELATAYVKIIDAKSCFEDIKNQNIEELKHYSRIIEKELQKIQFINSSIEKELKKGIIQEFSNIYERLLKLSSNFSSRNDIFEGAL